MVARTWDLHSIYLYNNGVESIETMHGARNALAPCFTLYVVGSIVSPARFGDFGGAVVR